MGLARSVVANTINFSCLLFQNSVLVMLFKDFVIQILEVPCWKLKQIHPSYQVCPRAKHGNPLSGWHRHRCFPLSPPATFPLMLYKSSLDYAMIKKKEWEITQEFGKGHMDLSQLQLVVGWICDALNMWTISTCGAEPPVLGQGPVPFSHRVILRASRYLGWGFLYVDVHREIRQAGKLNYSVYFQGLGSFTCAGLRWVHFMGSDTWQQVNGCRWGEVRQAFDA